MQDDPRPETVMATHHASTPAVYPQWQPITRRKPALFEVPYRSLQFTRPRKSCYSAP
jgi:hypothetical protein